MDKRIMNLAARITVMLLGAPGIGKTAAVNDFAKKIGADLVDVRLSAEPTVVSRERTISRRKQET